MTAAVDPGDLAAYRHRLAIDGPLAADVETLRALQVAHLRAVPFENSSVLFGEPMPMDAAAFVRKIGVAGRGGFCYELNGAFAALLTDLGFEVDLLEARVHNDGASLGPPFDHLALRVHLDEPWLVDVGFGYSFVEPLRLASAAEQQDPAGAFRLVAADGGLDLEWRHRDGVWRGHYRMSMEPRALVDFGPTCEFQRTSPNSPFTGGWMCSRSQEDGAITLYRRHLVDTRGDTREERTLDDADLPGILAARFGIAARFDGDRWTPDGDGSG